MNKELINSNCAEANLSPIAVKKFIEKLEKKVEIHGIVMIKNGEMILNTSFAPYTTDMPHVVNSVSKTFVGITIGLLYDRGIISLDDKVVDIFDDIKIDKENHLIESMTIKDVLTMSMGQMNNPYIDENRCWVEALLNNPITFSPGSMFHYDSLATYLLAAIVKKKTSKTSIDWLKEEIFAPMGIDKAYFLENHEGINVGGLGLFIPTTGLAKTGYLLLNKGVYNGTRLLSEKWCSMQLAKQIDNAPFFDESKYESRQGYGFQCWHCKNGGIRMSGLWGQMCLMIPEYNFVMAINARGTSSQPMLDVFDETILPELKSKDKVTDKKEQIELDSYLENQTIKAKISNDYQSKIVSHISGKSVKCKNVYGVTSFKVSFENDELRFELTKDGKLYHGIYGHNHLVKNESNIYDIFPPYYDTLSKDKNELTGWVQPNGYGTYYWENEGSLYLKSIYDNEATHFDIRIKFDYQYAELEWTPLTIFSRTDHIFIAGKYTSEK